MSHRKKITMDKENRLCFRIKVLDTHLEVLRYSSECLPWLAEVEHILKMLDVHNTEKQQLLPDWCLKLCVSKKVELQKKFCSEVENICAKDWNSDVSEQLPAATGTCWPRRDFELSLKKSAGIKCEDAGNDRLIQKFCSVQMCRDSVEQLTWKCV